VAKLDKNKIKTGGKPAKGLFKLISHAAWLADNQFARIRAVWPQFMHTAWVSGASATALVAIVLGASFLKTDNLDYSFARSENCIDNPLFLPGIASASADNYQVEHADARTIFGYPVFAARTCVHIKEPFLPAEQQDVFISHPFLPISDKKITLKTLEPAEVRLGRPVDMPLSTSGALVLHLSEADNTFDYELSANNKSVNCAKLDTALLCNLDNLELKQGGRYTFSVARYFNERPAGQVLQQKLDTVEPVKIIKSSIKPGQRIQNEPDMLILTANKTLNHSEGVSLMQVTSGKRTPVDISTEIKDKTLTISFSKPLKRSANFEMEIQDIDATDNAYLLKPYILKFSTSGGPKVAGANIGTYGTGTSQTIILNLDSEIRPSQNLADYISLSGNFKYSVSGSGQQIVVSPSGGWPRCSKFTVSLKDGLKNKHGISGGSAWQFSSRTICQTISVIGSSLEGRGIYAHRFGNGSQTVMFVGGVHGNEASSVYILNSWIDRLESGYDSIPSNKTIIVVPNANPDGLAAGSRTNSRDVDLNRNFPANDWKKDVVMPGGSLNKGGGGKSPLSELESSAIASYTLSQNPKLVMSYHAVGSLVLGNGAGQADAWAVAYASSVGYWVPSGNGVFDYDTTGAYEDWLRDKHGIPAILVELSSYYGNEFWNHQAAMWDAAGS